MRHDQGDGAMRVSTVTLSLTEVERLVDHFDVHAGVLASGGAVTKRYLADLRGCFRDTAAFERALAQGNSLVYTVSSVTPAEGPGDLHYGLGTIYPGQVGEEYFLTKGHIHSWRPAAELYIGLQGEGAMLLEDETTGQDRLVPLSANAMVYVPGHTFHRTVNVGDEPLVYLGIYPAQAGHDYQAIAARNFRSVVLKRDGKPCLIKRDRV